MFLIQITSCLLIEIVLHGCSAEMAYRVLDNGFALSLSNIHLDFVHSDNALLSTVIA